MDLKALFDPELAVLPIMVATWEEDRAKAVIVYQNSVLREELGAWCGTPFIQLLDQLTDGEGAAALEQLVSAGHLVISGKINGREVKYHSRLGAGHFQMAISDNTEINRLRDQQQRTSLINSFLNLGSHELKTPLNGILGLTELMTMEETDPEKKELLGLINESANILNDTVGKMLHMIYADQQEDAVPDQPSSVNLSSFIAKRFPVFQKHLARRNFSLASMQLNATGNIAFSEQHLNDIVTELAINLRRNTPQGKTIRISTSDEAGSVKMVIENQCQGIPPESLEEIFEPFFRYQDALGHASGYEYGQGGIGMGLTVIRKYMDGVQGKVWFENRDEYSEGRENVVRMHFIFPRVVPE